MCNGTDELRDQSRATEWIHEELTDWITAQAEADQPFMAYYTSPWPHAPVYAGDEFDGISGMGTYVDCITEFDTYLGELFATLEELGELEGYHHRIHKRQRPRIRGLGQRPARREIPRL